MIPVRQARDTILEAVGCLGTERVPVLDALGRVCAEEVVADITIPPLDNTAMDGFAVRAADTRGAAPERPAALRILRDLAAGSVSDVAVGPGEAIRIMTGAPIPPGADAVVRKEDTEPRADGRIDIVAEVPPGKEIRRAGEDVKPGDRVLDAGDEIRPAEVGILAAVGVASVAVRLRPRVAILSTGDELVEVGERPGPGQIINSNSYSLAALVRDAGAIPIQLGIARDRREALHEKLRHARSADVVITSGGVSVGDYDFVKEVLAELGTDMHFWKVAMKPGKPQAFGLMDGRPVFGLPGNPVSTMVSFEIFVRPALRKMMGFRTLFRRLVPATITHDVRKPDRMTHFVRVRVEESADGGLTATSTGSQSSGVLRSMSLANGLAVVPDDLDGLKAGDPVEVMLLDAGRLFAEARPF